MTPVSQPPGPQPPSRQGARSGGVRFFQIHREGKNINGHVTYAALAQAITALASAPAGSKVVEVDVMDNIVRTFPQQDAANGVVDVHQPKRPEETKWSRGDKIGLLALAVAVIALGGSFLVPEVRIWFGLEKRLTTAPARAAAPQTAEQKPTRSQEVAARSKSESRPRQSTRVHVTGKDNVAGNSISGGGNTTGNNNQVNENSHSINAPNSIIINGGTVDHPTVNNFGPPPTAPLTLNWTVKDVVPSTRADFKYQKEITVTPNIEYHPVSVGVTCDGEIGMIHGNFRTGGAFTNMAEGLAQEDSKVGYVAFETPSVTPSKPLLIFLFSKQPVSVLDVRVVKIKGIND